MIQLCANRDAIKYFNRTKVEGDNARFLKMFNKMAKTGGQTGAASLSNLSSAYQINSRSSLVAMKKFNEENDRIDYK